ncbi:glycosyltransferase family A protein [Maledivibacter halophilus]|uniref:Glycosyltransferases involved in cell wall biogenesis n=1 Tax=Maledivibacter halophilus TaxID=36842 RepID=A0A1T5K5I8_9FIRM|nr:glycosyltransferase family A protein [Maledivibacter halophilus]SKC58718.1 Glycosyltransferases involved in cell wall biogenesis [Maledivibacter halophilus]
MIYAVVPAKDEGDGIDKTLDMLIKTDVDKILILINGSTDNTLEKVSNINSNKIIVNYFNKPLGLDIPRAIGALFAYKDGAESCVFVDGDMTGDIEDNINEIIYDLSFNNIDMALTDCYHEIQNNSNMAKILLAFRRQLNMELGLFEKIGYAIPSHGPHGVSRRFIDKVGFESFAMPPVSLALAAKNNLNIKVSTIIPNHMLKSTIKDEYHACQIAKTIIGDCIEASLTYQCNPSKRGFDGMEFLGYHKSRRFDILKYLIEDDFK